MVPVNNPAITVVICMFKGEATVSRMIDCVLNQTFKDFELILVDDGSPDRCGEIADEYSQKDSRVRVLHKPNGGLADARNKALAIAQGEYTIQFDQDDWVELNCLEEMYAKAKEDDVDMLLCDFFQGDEYSMRYISRKPTSLDHESVLIDLFHHIPGFCWNKLIRLNVYNMYDIRFPDIIYSCEDQYTMAQLLMKNISIGYLPKAYVHYMYNDSSLSRFYNEKTYQVDLQTRKMFLNLLKDFPDAQKAAYESQTKSLVRRAFIFGNNYYSNKQFKNVFSEYLPFVAKSDIWVVEKWLIYLSCNSSFHFWNRIYHFGYAVKQLFKRISSK